MKRTIIFLMIALAGFMFVGVQSATAQWSVDVSIDDNNCNCNNITKKEISWVVRYTNDNTIFANGSSTFTTNPVTISGTESVDPDSWKTFQVCVNVKYYNENIVCCEGTRCKVFDWADIHIPTGSNNNMTVIMN
ncbi:MAG: hypothetical protein COW63_04490 [Bacteroidetes bacterium CG18_big_fil_WC_8_21_14_2_50_41_14]|nr:MAG: hypothetical protein COW63_04490 [Bacteroidetes bacterium CG18_big_fil_WC_8_21_14_2_50_41_14]